MSAGSNVQGGHERREAGGSGGDLDLGPPRAAVSSSPQPAPGSIWTAATSTGAPRSTTIDWPPVVVPQTVVPLSSISPPGPQPAAVLSGPVKASTEAPRAAEAQSRASDVARAGERDVHFALLGVAGLAHAHERVRAGVARDREAAVRARVVGELRAEPVRVVAGDPDVRAGDGGAVLVRDDAGEQLVRRAEVGGERPVRSGVRSPAPSVEARVARAAGGEHVPDELVGRGVLARDQDRVAHVEERRLRRAKRRASVTSLRVSRTPGSTPPMSGSPACSTSACGATTASGPRARRPCAARP